MFVFICSSMRFMLYLSSYVIRLIAKPKWPRVGKGLNLNFNFNYEKLTKTSGTTDSVQIGLGHAREVEVDDDIDGLDVNTTGEEIGTHQIAAQALHYQFSTLYTRRSTRTLRKSWKTRLRCSWFIRA